MSQPRNPYDFVPLESQPSYVDLPQQLRANGLCGEIDFTLTALTPVCVHHSPGEPEHGLHRFAHLDGQPTLPATSLKGMLRSAHEVVTNSTLGLLGTRRAWYRSRVPSAYLPGASPGRLTASEALFGMVGAEVPANSKRGKDAQEVSVGHAGRLFIDDISLPSALVVQPISRPAGGQPKPEHESFYFTKVRSGPILGRKFYYHQRSYQEVLAIYRTERRMPEIRVQALPAGTALSGKIRFVYLSEAELAALVYALALEARQAHKLGYGKPLGLGSVQVQISALRVEPTRDSIPARFWSYDPPEAEDWTPRVSELRELAKRAWLGRSEGQRSYAAFSALARWPQDENYVYPDFTFFRNQRGAQAQTTLWAYQGRRELYPGGASPPQTQTTLQPEVGSATIMPAVQSDTPAPETVPEAELRGFFAYADDIGYFVRDPHDGARYQCRSSDRKLMRRLAGMLSNDQGPQVAFRRDRQPGPDGKPQLVATDLRLLEENA